MRPRSKPAGLPYTHVDYKASRATPQIDRAYSAFARETYAARPQGAKNLRRIYDSSPLTVSEESGNWVVDGKAGLGAVAISTDSPYA